MTPSPSAADAQFIRMTETPIPKLIGKLAVPTIVSMMITSIYNLADTFFVSKLGTSATGAVGVVFSLMAIIQAVGFMLGMGSGGYISRLLGQKQNEKANEVASSAFFTAAMLGIAITLFGTLFLDTLMRALGATETILPYAEEYAQVILLGAPFMCTSFVMNNDLRAEGRAVLAMLVGVWLPMGRLSVPAGAFVGALVSILLVYGLSRSGGAVTPVRLILVGVAVSAMFQAFTNYLVYTAPDDAAVREATFWMLGGLGSAKWEDLPLLALILPPLFLVLMALARPLNAMLMGDSSAVTLGVDLDRVRGVLILSSALLTASAVAVSGCIGFVGLVIPHLVRSVVGADHRRLIPLSALCGAVFMIWMDVGARLAVRPEEIPVGIITAFIGAPLFLWMIRVRRYEF